MNLGRVAALAFCTVLCCCSAYAQPDFWALVHADDSLAKKTILPLKEFTEARNAAIELGYEVIAEGKIAYFVPVPAWSGGPGVAMLDLLTDAIESGFDRPIDPLTLPGFQRDHLVRYQKQMKLGGDLGELMKNSPLREVKVSLSIDVVFRSGDRSFIVPFSPKQIAGHFGPARKVETMPKSVPVEYPDRPELFGLRSTDFALSVSRQTDSNVFDRIFERAKELVMRRSGEVLRQIDQMVERALEAEFASEDAKRFLEGEAIGFGDLPRGLRQFLSDGGRRFPHWFGLSDPNDADSFLASCAVSVRPGFSRAFVDFTIKRPNGQPATVSFEIQEIAR